MIKGIEFTSEDSGRYSKADMCGCSECGWKGKCSDCETEWESDGWENPQYEIHLCPVCEDGRCIDDYWYSDELTEKII